MAVSSPRPSVCLLVLYAAGFFLLWHDREMIKTDQPSIFKSKLIVALSSVDDGNMRTGLEDSDEVVTENRRKFLSKNMIALQSTVLCGVTYDRENFTEYTAVKKQDKGRGMVPGTEMIVADALTTDEKDCALFLPLADCVGAILYDPARQPRLMLAHLGRHSIEQDGVAKCLEFMKFKYGTKPEDLLIWIGPSPNGEEYPLWKRDNKSFREVVREDLASAGVREENIEVSGVDTVMDTNYFSHSEFLKGNRDANDRFAIVAKLR